MEQSAYFTDFSHNTQDVEPRTHRLNMLYTLRRCSFEHISDQGLCETYIVGRRLCILLRLTVPSDKAHCFKSPPAVP